MEVEVEVEVEVVVELEVKVEVEVEVPRGPFNIKKFFLAGGKLTY